MVFNDVKYSISHTLIVVLLEDQRLGAYLLAEFGLEHGIVLGRHVYRLVDVVHVISAERLSSLVVLPVERQVAHVEVLVRALAGDALALPEDVHLQLCQQSLQHA